MNFLRPDPDSNINRPPFSQFPLRQYQYDLIPHSFTSLPPALPSYKAQNETTQTLTFSPPSSIYHVHLNGWSNNNIKIGEVVTQGIGSSSMSMSASPNMKIMREEAGQHNMNNNIATFDVKQRSNLFLPSLEVNRYCWLPAVQPQGDEQYRSLAKALRNRRRLARQKKNHNSGCSQFVRRSCIRKNSSMHSASSGNVVAHDIFSGSSFLPHMNMKLNFVLLKKLTHSDVSDAGRIVLPKRESEAHLPHLDDKEGIQLIVRDVFTSYAWQMKFKFWLNNNGRLYVLENAGDFIQKYELKRKDFIVLYQDESNQIYVCAKKTNASTSQLEPTTSTRSEEETKNNNKQIFMQSNNLSEQEQSGGEGKRSSGGSNANGVPNMIEIGESSSANDGLHIDTRMAEIEVDDLPESEKFPGFDEYGLSIYDLRPGDKYDVMLIR